MRTLPRIPDGVRDPRTGDATHRNLHEMPMIALPCMIRRGRTCTDMEPSGRLREAAFRQRGQGRGRTGIHEATVRRDVDGPRDLHRLPGPPAVGKVAATRGTRGGTRGPAFPPRRKARAGQDDGSPPEALGSAATPEGNAEPEETQVR